MSDSVSPWTVAHQAPLSMEFSRPEYWSRLPCPSPEDLPYPGEDLRADSLMFELPGFHESEVKMKSLSHVRLFATPWTVAYQAPPSMGFSWQEYWSGLPFPSPGDLPDPGIEPRSPALGADALTSEPPGKPRFHEAPLKSLKFPFCLNYQDLLLLPQKSE